MKLAMGNWRELVTWLRDNNTHLNGDKKVDDLHQKIGMLEEKLSGRAAKIHDLEVRILELENVLWRIANPVSAFQKDAEKEGAKLDGHAAIQMSNDASILQRWADSALQN
jgi:hypothetical protein